MVKVKQVENGWVTFRVWLYRRLREWLRKLPRHIDMWWLSNNDTLMFLLAVACLLSALWFAMEQEWIIAIASIVPIPIFYIIRGILKLRRRYKYEMEEL